MPSNISGLQSDEVLKDEINSLDTKYAKLEHPHDELVFGNKKLYFHESDATIVGDNTTYFKNTLKYLCEKFPNQSDVSFLLKGGPQIAGISIVVIHDTNALNSEGLPMFSTINFFPVGVEKKIIRCGTYGGTWSLREI